MKIEDFLIRCCSQELDYSRNGNEPFYEYIKRIFAKYKEDITFIQQDEFHNYLVNNYFKGNATKKRFSNATSIIINECEKILQYCYKGNLWKAGEILENLFLSKHKLNRYLEDYYINYFRTELVKRTTFYRMRDDKEQPNDCWHIPYEKRYKASAARYSFAGIPALYLADSKETADKELGNLEKGSKRWVSEFKLKKNLFLLNLQLPSVKAIRTADKIDLVNFLITYPIRLLCSTKAIHNKTCEEYFVPQLLCHWLSKENQLISFSGIIYNSTVNNEGVNYVLPASYKGLQPINGHSPILTSLFEASYPVLYKSNN